MAKCQLCGEKFRWNWVRHPLCRKCRMHTPLTNSNRLDDIQREVEDLSGAMKDVPDERDIESVGEQVEDLHEEVSKLDDRVSDLERDILGAIDIEALVDAINKENLRRMRQQKAKMGGT